MATRAKGRRYSRGRGKGVTAKQRPDSRLARLVNAGITGFLPKGTTQEDFLATIRTVAKGSSVLPPSRPSGNGHERLTPRQRQIFSMISKGVSRKKIARQLHITTSTVASHVQSILRKLMERP
ncbi:MAG TPA: response regulator transcription factor [Bacteroidota bacterium]|nr:response regulator transcription factor [Bacteroidota bacterium]